MFSRQLSRAGLGGFDREYEFATPRKWKFDFAWPAAMIAVEVEGGVWTSGRHTRGAGYIKDCEKYNAAALGGWTIFRFVPQWIEDETAIETIRTAFAVLR